MHFVNMQRILFPSDLTLITSGCSHLVRPAGCSPESLPQYLGLKTHHRRLHPPPPPPLPLLPLLLHLPPFFLPPSLICGPGNKMCRGWMNQGKREGNERGWEKRNCVFKVGTSLSLRLALSCSSWSSCLTAYLVMTSSSRVRATSLLERSLRSKEGSDRAGSTALEGVEKKERTERERE